MFNIFLNDLEIKLGNETLGFKYADDFTIIASVYDDIDHSADLINQFVRWAGQNRMNSNFFVVNYVAWPASNSLANCRPVSTNLLLYFQI